MTGGQMEPSGVLVDDEPSVFYYSEAEKFLRIPLEASANPSRSKPHLP